MKKSFKRKCIEFFARRGQKSDALAKNHYLILSFFYQTLPATVVSILAYFIIYYSGIVLVFVGGTNTHATRVAEGFVGALMVWLIVCLIDSITIFCCQSALKNEAKQEDQQAQKAASEQERMIRFYKECRTNGVTDITDPYDQKKAELIAQRLGYRYNDIKQYYREAETAATQNR